MKQLNNSHNECFWSSVCPALCQMLHELSLAFLPAGLEITSEAQAGATIQEREHVF